MSKFRAKLGQDYEKCKMNVEDVKRLITELKTSPLTVTVQTLRNIQAETLLSSDKETSKAYLYACDLWNLKSSRNEYFPARDTACAIIYEPSDVKSSRGLDSDNNKMYHTCQRRESATKTYDGLRYWYLDVELNPKLAPKLLCDLQGITSVSYTHLVKSVSLCINHVL